MLLFYLVCRDTVKLLTNSIQFLGKTAIKYKDYLYFCVPKVLCSYLNYCTHHTVFLSLLCSLLSLQECGFLQDRDHVFFTMVSIVTWTVPEI